MFFYLLRRLGTGLVLAVLASFITFLLLGPSLDGIVANRLGPAATPETTAALKADLGFDRPLVVQYLDWLGDAVRGDFGTSLTTGEPIAEVIPQRFGVTMSIVLVALLITVVVSVVLGVLAATRGGAVDRVTQGVSLSGHLFPSLLVAIVLVYLLSIKGGLLPATGFTPFSEDPLQWARSITIPVIALVITGIAGLTAQVRGSMIDELRKDYVRTLRTRGLPMRTVILRHALRNAAGPALTVLSFEFLTMLGGALIIESVFAIAGFGGYAFETALQGDVPAIMGVTVFAVLLVIIVNLAVDLVNGWLNPKARIY